MSTTDFKKALESYEAGDATSARGLIDRLAALTPPHVSVHIIRARLCEAGGDWRGAFDSWATAAFWVPNSQAIKEGMARSLENLAADAASGGARTVSGLAPPRATDLVGAELGADLAAIDFTEIDFGPEIGSEPAVTSRPAPAAGGATSPATTGDEQLENLDKLIDELETARIVPREDLDSIPEPDLEPQIDEVVSETLARIYESQEEFFEAARVYKRLADQHPERADEFAHKAEEMQLRARS